MWINEQTKDEKRWLVDALQMTKKKSNETFILRHFPYLLAPPE